MYQTNKQKEAHRIRQASCLFVFFNIIYTYHQAHRTNARCNDNDDDVRLFFSFCYVVTDAKL